MQSRSRRGLLARGGLLALAGALSLLLVACESAGGETPADTGSSAGGGDGNGGELDGTGASGPVVPLPDDADLSGRWALHSVHAANAELPVIGATKSRTTSRMLMNVAQDGRDLTLTVTVCSLEIDNGTEMVETIVPAALVASLPVTERPARLEPVEGGLRFVQPRFVDIRGAVLDDPDDPLPTAADDPRVVDQDEDGQPGVTLRVTGIVDGELAVVQRGADAFFGTQHSEDRIDGLVEWTDEQIVLETDNDLLASDRDSTPAAPEESWFRLVRVDPGTDCAAVLANAATLFAD